MSAAWYVLLQQSIEEKQVRQAAKILSNVCLAVGKRLKIVMWPRNLTNYAFHPLRTSSRRAIIVATL